VVSGKKMCGPGIPQDIANVTSVNGSRATVGAGRSWALVSGCGRRLEFVFFSPV
jgi:hypothetical protein